MGKETLVRLSLMGNAAFSTLSGVVLMAAAGPLAEAMGVVDALTLRIVGGVLLFYALDLFQQARRPDLSRGKIVYFIAMDGLWVTGTALLLWGLALPFTEAGEWILLGVADVVAVLGVLQAVGLRRLGSSSSSSRQATARQGEAG